MLALLAAALLAGQPPAAQPNLPQPAAMPLDVETTLGAVPAACTGIGLDARSDPRWQGYGVRIELSDARNQYLVGGTVTVRDGAGRTLLTARCDAPWLLLRLPPGRYDVAAQVEGSAMTRSARVVPPASGQMRVVLQFKDVEPVLPSR